MAGVVATEPSPPNRPHPALGPDLIEAGGGLASAEARRSTADGLAAQVLVDPANAVALAQRLIAAAGPGEETTGALAWRAVALAAVHLGDLEQARTALDAAAAAARSGPAELGGLVALAAVPVLAEQGQLGEALAQAELAARLLQGAARAEALLYRGMVRQMSGEETLALADFAAAAGEAQRHGDVRTEVRALHNRGTLHTRRGHYDAARSDLAASAQASREAGLSAAAALSTANLAELATLEGDLPEALRRAEELRFVADPDPVGLLHLADCLLAARLPAEARLYARTARDRLASAGLADAAVAALRVAEAELDAGNLAAATAVAEDAAATLAAQGRATLADEARLVELAARVRSNRAGLRRSAAHGPPPPERADPGPAAAGSGPAVGDPAPMAADPRPAAARSDAGAGSPTSGDLAELAIEALRLAARFEAASRHRASLDARLAAAECALAAGDRAAVDAALANLAVDPGASADRRVRLWHAEVLRAAARGDRAATRAAAQAGLAELDAYRAQLGAAELRAAASELGSELAAWTVATSLGGPPEDLLDAIETVRAPSLRTVPVRAPRDEHLRELLGRLRALGEEGDDAERAKLERAVLTRTRQLRGSAASEPQAPAASLVAAANPALAFLSLAPHDGGFVVARARGGAVSARTDLPDEVFAGLSALRQALDRLARPGGPSQLRETAFDLARSTLEGIDAALLDDGLLLDAPTPTTGATQTTGAAPTGGAGAAPGEMVVVSAPAELTALPWAALPRLAGRAVVVVPSVAVWARVAGMSPRPLGGQAPTVVVAGPGLIDGDAEAAAIAAQYPAHVLLQGGDATVANVVGTLEDAALLHVAAHGRFPADHPLLTSVRLADGPLTLYDLDALGSLPSCIVLSTCDAGLTAARAGHETLGLVSSLLQGGARTVIAAGCRVPDGLTRRFMVALHRQLAAGVGPAAAAAHARAATADDPVEALLLAAFNVHGAG